MYSLPAVALVFLLTASCWQQTPVITPPRCSIGATVLLAISLAIAWHPPIWQAALAAYQGDSFYTLSIAPAIGLAVLSAALGAVLLAANVYKTRRLQAAFVGIPASLAVLLDGLLTVGLFWLAITLVPQLYYAYYQLVFDNLPAQWVIKRLSAIEFWRIAGFSGKTSLAAHFSGLLLWASLILQWLLWLPRFVQRKHSVQCWQAAAIIASMALAWHFVIH